jgi:hypothetical protein
VLCKGRARTRLSGVRLVISPITFEREQVIARLFDGTDPAALPAPARWKANPRRHDS